MKSTEQFIEATEDTGWKYVPYRNHYERRIKFARQLADDILKEVCRWLERTAQGRTGVRAQLVPDTQLRFGASASVEYLFTTDVK